MDQANSTTFSITEEAFLLASLKEVVNVWARGNGQASFNLSIKDGLADLQLGFQLGRVTDPHLPHLHHHEAAPAFHQDYQTQPYPRRKWKGPARRNRDRARAAQHQARHQPEAAAAATEAVILPFTGKLLPIAPKAPPPKLKPVAAVPASTTTPPSAPPCAPPLQSYKTATATPPQCNDQIVNGVKKKLFSSNLLENQKPSAPPSTKPPGSEENFKIREEQLWTKLFT